MKHDINVVVPHTAHLGEGPVWDSRRQLIMWVDILRKQIHFHSPALDSFRSIDVAEYVGAVCVCEDGRLLAAIKTGFAYIDRDSGKIDVIIDPEPHLPNNRFNDGKCDPAGRFWAGTMSHTDEPNKGTLYCLEKDFTLTKKITGTSISNGMAWTHDHLKYFHIDTPTRIVSSYDYDKVTGNISNKKLCIDVPSEDGFPDGMTIDNEDMLWIAHWNGGQLTRWNPETGKKIHSIKMPVPRISCCTFGGPDFRDIYVTTARKDLNETELATHPLAGSLFVIKNSGFQGVDAFRFGGSK